MTGRTNAKREENKNTSARKTQGDRKTTYQDPKVRLARGDSRDMGKKAVS